MKATVEQIREQMKIRVVVELDLFEIRQDQDEYAVIKEIAALILNTARGIATSNKQQTKPTQTTEGSRRLKL